MNTVHESRCQGGQYLKISQCWLRSSMLAAVLVTFFLHYHDIDMGLDIILDGQ